MNSGFVLTLISCWIVIHGSISAPSEVKKEPQESVNDVLEDEKRQAAVHQYRSVCHGDGTCTYIFTLTVPSKLGMPLPLDVNSMMGSIDADSPKVQVIQQQLQVLHNSLYNLTTANHEETMMLTSNINDIQTNVNHIDTKVKDVDSHTRMLNDGYATLRNDVGQIEAKVAAATQSLDTKLSKVKAEMVQVEGELKSMEEYFAMYKDGVSKHDLLNFQYIIKVKQPQPAETPAVGTDCSVLYNAGMNISGVYSIKPDPSVNATSFDVYCDMETDGGGWTVVQRREDGMQNFNRLWADYRDGFGELTGEYWLGLEKMYILNLRGNSAIRFDMWDFAGATAHALYSKFFLFGEDDKYRIQVGQYSGDAGNAFHYGNHFLRHSNQQFSTKDNDNDRFGRNCPEMYSSGWWFHNCMVANLNGLYYEGGVYKSHHNDGIMWRPWRYDTSLKKTEIKVRPANFLKNQRKVIAVQSRAP